MNTNLDLNWWLTNTMQSDANLIIQGTVKTMHAFGYDSEIIYNIVGALQDILYKELF